MSMMAACPKCGVENSPMNTACDICGAPLGAQLIAGGKAAELKPMGWLAVATGITLVLCILAWFLRLHPVTLVVAAFYGPMFAAYRSNTNVVWHAALGGLLGLAVLVVVAIAMTWETSRGMLAAIIGARPPTVDYDGNVVGTSSTVVGLLGILVLVFVVFPCSLIGGSVGEHLAARRRLAGSAPVATPAKALSEQELAKVAL